MNPIIHFSIKVNALDCYLYGGYLFIVLNDGRVVNVSYHQIINCLKAQYPEYANLIELVFLHNEYSKSEAARILFGVEEIKETFRHVWQKASEEIVFELNFSDIEGNCNTIDVYQSIPLDLRAYGGRLFLGCQNGLFESKLNMDGSYQIKPSLFSKCFDGKVIGLNARNSTVVVSADWDGLLKGEVLDFDTNFRIDEGKSYAKRSLRTGWMTSDVVNYNNASNFDYIYNECVDRVKNDNKNFYTTTKIREKKVISQFAKAVYGMEDLFSRTKIDRSDIMYSFNSSDKSFFVMNDGSIVNAKIKEGKIDEPFYISQRVKPFGEQKKFAGKPLSSCFVYKGCVLEYFDGVVLIQNHEMINLCDRPVNSVRSYLNSNNYRDIVSIVDDDSISLNAIFNIDDIKSQPAFPKTAVRHDNSSKGVVYGDLNEELPF